MKHRILALLTLLALVVAARPLKAADEPYEMYAIISLTGSASFLGRDEVPAIQAFEKWTNGHGGIRGRPIHITILDEASNPTVAVQLANQLIAKKVPFVLGPGLGATCESVIPLVTNGPVIICLTSVGHPAAGSYAFLFNLTNKDYEANAIRFLKAKGVRTLALLQTTDASGLDAQKQVEEALATYPDLRDLKVVDTENYANTDLTVAAQLTRIKASGADAIVNYVTGPALGTSLRGISEIGYTGWVFTSASNATREQMKQYSNFLPEKLIFGTVPYQMNVGVSSRVLAMKAAFRDAMRQVGINEPTIGNMLPWDPLLVYAEGLRKYGFGITAQQMRDYILSLHDWAGMMGPYDFRRGDQRGIDPKGSGAMRYDKSTDNFVVISRPGGAPL
jgi:ABC-type branched-subunit amino acid transport system substrate-binding protein